MIADRIKYCESCGEMRFSANGVWRGSLCMTCAAKKRMKDASRKCAGCEIVIDLSMVEKSNRGRVKYHSHDCYVAHRWGKPCTNTK